MTASRDLADLTSWQADWRGLRIAVLGLGVTGFSVADTLVELGAEVLVAAGHGSTEHRGLLDVIGAGFVTAPDDGPIPAELEAFGAELVVVSPGYPPAHPLVEWVTSRGIPIWGDIELAWRLRDKVRAAEWICITGTNGKTTTTQLTASMLVAAGIRAAPAGNIGVPVLDAIRDPAGFDVLVIELSSHQLHWMGNAPGGEVAPLASACLNLRDDHLEWHGSAASYRDAKAEVYARTRVACVYNIADEATRVMVEDAEVQEGCRAIGFGLGIPGSSEVGLVEEVLVDRAFLDERRTSALELATLDDLRAPGLASPHHVMNVLAAAALARAADVPPVAVRDAVRAFELGPHRGQRVADADGVIWIDDSKATNADAARAALQSLDSVVWVVGGLLKGADIAPLVRDNVGRLRGAVVIGVDRGPVLDAFARHAPGVPLTEVDEPETERVMLAAVRAASVLVRPGDAVLLAPSAASQDQFADYADRGRRFAAAVRDQVGGSIRDDDAGSPGPDDPTV